MHFGPPQQTTRKRKTVKINALVVRLLLRVLLGLLLLGAQVVGDQLQHVRRDLELGANDGLGGGDKTVAARLLVFVIVGGEQVLPALVGHVHGEVDDVNNLALDGRRVLLDDGEALLDLAEPVVGQVVGAFDVACDVAVGLGQVGHNGLAEAVVDGIAQVKRLLAVRVRLVGADEIRDDRV